MSARCIASARCSRIFLAALWFLPLVLRAADGQLRVQYFNVGQGDAALITCPDGTHHMLIDSGDNKYPGSQQNLQQALAANLGPAGPDRKTRLNVAIASHPHSDHLGGMEWVLKNYRVGTYIDNGRPAETTTWSNLNEVRKKQVKAGTLVYVNGKTASLSELKLCDKVTFTLITPSATAPKLTDPNDQSVGVRLVYGDRSFLFVGDMEDHAEDVWLHQLPSAAKGLLNVDVLKVGHHGSNTSSTMAFIVGVSPDIAVISCGLKDTSTNIRYKHPRTVTLDSYTTWFAEHKPPQGHGGDTVWAYNKDAEKWVAMKRPAGLWVTVNDGDVTVTTDGHNLSVQPDK